MNHFTDNIVEPALWFLADWSLRWAVLIGVLAVWVIVWRPQRTVLRYLVCWVVLGAGLLVPALPRWGPGFGTMPADAPPSPTPIPIPYAPVEEVRTEPTEREPSPPAPAEPITVSPTPEAAPIVEETPPSTPPEPPPSEPLGFRRMLLLGLAGLWVMGLAAFLIRWGGGWLLLLRLRQTAIPVAGAPAQLFDGCRMELGLRRHARLSVHPRIRSPLTLGLVRPTVLVPATWLDLPEADQHGSLLHELAHLAHYDDWLALFLELVRAVFFFHPLVRWLLVRLERDRELLCDETAIRHGIDPRGYVQMLLEFANQPGRLQLVGSSYPLRFGNRRTVKTRIHHLLEENMDRWMTPLSIRRSVALGAVVLALAVGLGSLRVGALEPNDPPGQEGTGTVTAERRFDLGIDDDLAAPTPSSEPKGPPDSAKLPTRVAPFQVLEIHGTGLPPARQISGLFLVEPEGTVLLGLTYGRIKLEGLTFREAGDDIEKQLQKADNLLAPKISVELVGWIPKTHRDASQKVPYVIEPADLLKIEADGILPRYLITGTHLVQPDGTVNLGLSYGFIKVGGLSLSKAETAVEERLRKTKKLANPKVGITLAGWENDWYDLRARGPRQAAKATPAQEKESLATPYRVKPSDVLRIRVNGAAPREPIDDVYLVEPDGKVNLGYSYGRLVVSRLTLDEVTTAIDKRLREVLANPQVSASLAGWVTKWQLDPSRKHPYRIRPRQVLLAQWLPPGSGLPNRLVVDLDGKIDLGPGKGRVLVSGLSLEEAEKVAGVPLTMGGWERDWRRLEEDEPPRQEPVTSGGTKGRLRYGGKGFNEWRTELTTELKPEIRAEGIKALSTFGVNGYGAEAATAIMEVMRGYDPALGDPADAQVIQAGLNALVKIDGPALPVVLDSLRKGDRNVRRVAILALAHLGRRDNETVFPTLLASMQDKDPYIRREAMKAIYNNNPNAPQFVDALVRMLQDKQEDLRRDALVYLNNLGSRSRTGVPALIQTLKDDNARIRQMAVEALWSIGPDAKAAAPALIQTLKDSDQTVRKQALNALQAIRPKAEAVVPALIEALKDPSLDVQLGAINYLGSLGAEAKEAVPALVKILENFDKRGEWLPAVQALGRMGPAANDAFPALTRLLNSGDATGLRDAILAAMSHIAPQGRDK